MVQFVLVVSFANITVCVGIGRERACVLRTRFLSFVHGPRYPLHGFSQSFAPIATIHISQRVDVKPRVTGNTYVSPLDS